MSRSRFGSLVAAGAVACTSLIVIGPQANAARPKCLGERATKVAKPGQRTNGTTGDDVIVGTNGDDVIKGKGGSDIICGLGGKDRINGGGDTDMLVGGRGNDTLNGAAGIGDGLFGGRGDDLLDGGGGVFNVADYSLSKTPVVVDLATQTGTGEGTDTIINIGDVIGTPFDDTLTGNDIIDGNLLAGGLGDDILDGGGGLFDLTAHFFAEGSVTVDLAAQTAVGEGSDTLIDIEDAIGGNFDDTLIGNDGPNLLVGLLGNDTLDGGAGSDVAAYGYAGGPAIVNLATQTGSTATPDAVDNDTLVSIENAFGSFEFDDVLIGDDGPNWLVGEGGNDDISGEGGDDSLHGDAVFPVGVGGQDVELPGSIDKLDGGTGTDSCFLGEDVINCEIDSPPEASTKLRSGRLTGAFLISERITDSRSAREVGNSR